MADYHNNMSADLFKKWISEKLLPNLESKTIIAMDNAQYHSTIETKQPSVAWKKQEIE